MAVTTKTQITDAETEFFNSELLLRARPFLALAKMGLERPLPLNTSTQVRFRRYGVMAVTTTNLSEPTTESPDRAAVQASITDVTGTILKRGNGLAFTDQVLDTSAENVRQEGMSLIGQNAGESVETYYRNVLSAGTSKIYANGSARGDVNTAIDGDDVRRAARTLERNTALKVTQIVKASTGVGTVPIPPSYFGHCNPDVVHTLRQLTGFRRAEEYAQQAGIDGMADGEVGELHGIRFVMSTLARIYTDSGAAVPSGIQSTSGTLSDVYETLIFGQQAYGKCPLKGKGLVTIIKGLGSAGTADFLDEMSTIAWKFRGVCVILNDNFMTAIESAAAA